MINGAHVILYSKNADADRAFLRDVLKFPHVDVGHGWLIFALPPSEVAVHPTDDGDTHELFLMCDQVKEVVRTLAAEHIDCSPIQELRWGSLTQVTLPSGAKLGLYQPKHPRPPAPRKRRRATTKRR